MQLGADDHQDMVIIRLNHSRPMVRYPIGLEIAARLRMACKMAARYDRAPATFWRDCDVVDLGNCPKPHRGIRESGLVPTALDWDALTKGPLVALRFDDLVTQMPYEEGIHLHREIQRASRRAKAWAGDASRAGRMLGNLTNAEDDYRLGLA